MVDFCIRGGHVVICIYGETTQLVQFIDVAMFWHLNKSVEICFDCIDNLGMSHLQLI